MSLKPNDRAPDFTLDDQDGKPVRLSELWAKGPVVLFFYPKDDTAGCTAEACAFRDNYDAFQTAGASVVGISSQGVASKKAFATKNGLPFLLVSDPGGRVRGEFGVKGNFLGLIDGRETFIIGQGGVVRHVFNSQIQPLKHVTEALAVLSALRSESRA